MAVRLSKSQLSFVDDVAAKRFAITAAPQRAAVLYARQQAICRPARNDDCGRLGTLIGVPFEIGILNDGPPLNDGSRLASKASCVLKPGEYTLLQLLALIGVARQRPAPAK
jgi:hypothetical protein